MIKRAANSVQGDEKTKAELFQEVETLRARVAELEQAKRDLGQKQTPAQKQLEEIFSLIANIPDVIWTTDFKGNTTFISPNVERVYGYTPEEIYKEGDRLWFGRIHPDDVEKIKDAYKTLFEKGVRFDIEYRIKRKDGEWIWLHDRSVVTYQKDGVMYADGVSSDVTECGEVEDALIEAKEHTDRVMEGILEAIAIIDLDGIIRRVNSEFERGSGWKREEAVGKAIVELGVMSEEESQRIEKKVKPKLMNEGFVRDIETVVIRRDGTKFPALMSWTLMRDAEGKPTRIITVAKDITERLRREEELSIYREKMARTEKLASLGTLSATLAHELTQSLTVINLSIENSLAQLQKTSCLDTVTEALRDSLTEVSNAASIVDRFRNFARKSSEKPLSKVDLRSVADRIVRLLNESALRARVTLRLKGMDKLPPNIFERERPGAVIFFAG